MKSFERGIKVVEMVLGKRLCNILTVNEKQFDFVHEKGTIDAMFVLKSLLRVLS